MKVRPRGLCLVVRAGPFLATHVEALITYIARALVDRPDAVELRAQDAEGGKLYELKVAPEDVGKVIGRDGRTVNALRTLVMAAAQKQGSKARVEILDDRRPSKPAAGEAAPPQDPQAP